MNKKLKGALQEAFKAPPPIDKEHFLKQLNFPKITYVEFLMNQLHYIRKRVWIASLMIVLLGWGIAHWSPIFLSISGVLPYLAMITVTEIYRSASDRMAELEGSCRFNLQQIVMARMSILGGINLFVILVAVIFINKITAYGILLALLYSLVPYLIVCAICMWLLNRTKGAESLYACAIATGSVSIGNILCESMAKFLYSSTNLHAWLAVLACCIILIGFQIKILIKQTEDQQWNLN
ncbi:hypothetical protein [Fusibacter bizertensis]